MTKVDGRTLRKDLNRFLRENFPNHTPSFTVQTVWENDTEPVYEVYFTDLDDPSGSWSLYLAATDFVNNVWWPQNRRNARASRTDYSFGREYNYKPEVKGINTVLGAFAV